MKEVTSDEEENNEDQENQEKREWKENVTKTWADHTSSSKSDTDK